MPFMHERRMFLACPGHRVLRAPRVLLERKAHKVRLEFQEQKAHRVRQARKVSLARKA